MAIKQIKTGLQHVTPTEYMQLRNLKSLSGINKAVRYRYENPGDTKGKQGAAKLIGVTAIVKFSRFYLLTVHLDSKGRLITV